jgi:hypothetical protein
MKQERTWPAILSLCLLAAVIPESIASLNTPFLAYVLDPFTLVWMVLAYGGAALLIREAMVRKRLGWTSIIVLGWAYAAINEGMVAGTWFKMKPEGFQIILGVDWLWAVALSIFHACFSMVVPICLANLLFPHIATHPWLRARGIKIALGSLVLLMVLGLLINNHRPWVLLVGIYVAVLAYSGLSLPPARPRRHSFARPPSLWRLHGTGFAGYIGFFLVMYAVPAIVGHASHADATQIIDIGALLAFAGWAVFLVRKWTRSAGWGSQQTLALITGSMACATLVSLVVPLGWAGLQPLLTVPFLGVLLWKARALRRSAPAVPLIPATNG